MVDDDGRLKDSNIVKVRDVDSTLDGEGMVELFASTLFIAYSDDISSKKTILFVSYIISFLSSLWGVFEINKFCLRVDFFSN